MRPRNSSWGEYPVAELSWDFIIKDMPGSGFSQSLVRPVLHHILTFSFQDMNLSLT